DDAVAELRRRGPRGGLRYGPDTGRHFRLPLGGDATSHEAQRPPGQPSAGNVRVPDRRGFPLLLQGPPRHDEGRHPRRSPLSRLVPAYGPTLTAPGLRAGGFAFRSRSRATAPPVSRRSTPFLMVQGGWGHQR